MNTSGSCGARASALPLGFRPARSLATLLALAAVLFPTAGQAQKESLASKVQHLEDTEEIRTVLVNYGRTLDAHDFGAYSRLFAKEGEWIGGFGTVKGPAAIEAFMAKNIGSPGKPSGTYHLLTNFIIDVHGDTATVWSRWAYVTPGPDKKPAMAQGGHYEDTLVLENGQWKFSRREAFLDIPHPEAPAAK
jgi:3-phenylpropionate/cinnamic acid dioxygenase small subunit